MARGQQVRVQSVYAGPAGRNRYRGGQERQIVSVSQVPAVPNINVGIYPRPFGEHVPLQPVAGQVIQPQDHRFERQQIDQEQL